MNQNLETAKRLKTARQAARISRRAFGKKIERTERTVARIEAGEVSITIEMVDLYSSIANVSREHLLLGKEPLTQALEEIRAVRKEMNDFIIGANTTLTARLTTLERAFIAEWGAPYENYTPKLKQSVKPEQQPTKK